MLKKKLFLFYLSFFLSCNEVERLLDKKILPRFGADSLLDQGMIYFDNVGNINVEVNNLDFKGNPAFTEASYIGVWVYKRNADPLQNCCSGSSRDCGVQANSCIVGVGFSNDLGFLGPNFINRVPPQPFNKTADKFYISVKLSDNRGVPQDYQGEYTLFSATTNPVADRSQFDLYLGVFYNVLKGPRLSGLNGLRPVGDEAIIGNRKYYTRIDPDWLSPKIQIESRFFPQTREDPAGSTYAIPHMITWKRLSPVDRELDKRGRIRINEIGSFINNQTSNDFIELYNTSDQDVILDDVFIQKYTPANCQNFKDTSSKEDLTGIRIKAKSFYTLSRSGSTLSNIDRAMKEITVGDNDCFALTRGSKKLDTPTETEPPGTEERSRAIVNGVETITDPRIIDFVGLEDPDRKNNYLGTSPAPSLIGSRGSAISRCGDGQDTRNNGVDFTFQSPSPGRPNTCIASTSISQLSPGEIVISEVSARNNTSGCVDGDDDFIELYNRSGKVVNLAGAKLYYIASTGTVTEYFQFESFILQPNSSVAVVSKDSGCYNSTSLAGRNVLFKTVTSSAFNLSSQEASIVLARNGNTFPTTQTGPSVSQGSTVVLDYIGYGDAPRIYEANPSNIIDNYSASRCLASTDTDRNAFDFQIETPTPGISNSCGTARQIAAALASELVISEIHTNADTSTGFEGGGGTNCLANADDFVEIYNRSTVAFNLAGGRLVDINSGGTVGGNNYTFGNLIINPNSYVVLVSQDAGCYTTASLTGRNFVFKGGGGFDLSSQGGTVVLTRNSTTLPGPQSGPAIDQGSNFVIDYVGYCGNTACSASNAIVFETARAPHCESSNGTVSLRTSRIRTNPNIDTNNNSNDFSCGVRNGRPGAAN
jgi:hypothetical protein